MFQSENRMVTKLDVIITSEHIKGVYIKYINFL